MLVRGGWVRGRRVPRVVQEVHIVLIIVWDLNDRLSLAWQMLRMSRVESILCAWVGVASGGLLLVDVCRMQQQGRPQQGMGHHLCLLMHPGCLMFDIAMD